MALPTTQPAVVRSKGPNGTHWFSDTPWLGAIGSMAVGQKQTVACTIAAIETAVDGLAALGTAAAKAKVDAGYAILVQDGTLIGGATGPFNLNSTIYPVVMLDGKGDNSWTKKLLITPLNGPGKVRVNGQIQFEGTKKIAWVGMPSYDPNNTRRYARDGYLINNCNEFGFGWCESSSIRVNVNAGKTSNNIELKEFGWEGKITREGDYAGLGVNATGTLNGLLLDGFIMPPTYHLITVPWKKDAPSDAHSDSWQIQSGPNVTNVVYRDGRVHASTNTAFQNGGYQNLLFDNILIIGGKDKLAHTPGGAYSYATWFYPYENNEATDGNHAAFNGGATITCVNCEVTGALGSTTFLPGTTGTKISYAWTGATRARVTVDTSLTTRTPTQVYAISPKFDAARQAAIFGGTFVPPTDTQPPSTPGMLDTIVTGTTVTITLTASADNVGVVGYYIYRDGVQVYDLTSGLTWDDSGRTPGANYTYTAKAYDAVPLLSGFSNPKTATIATSGDGEAPTGSIISPVADLPVQGTIEVQVSAADNVSVSWVRIYSGSTKLGETTYRSADDVWVFSFNTLAGITPDGTYPIQAWISDGTNRYITATVNVTVRNTPIIVDPKPPTAPVATATVLSYTEVRIDWLASTPAPVEYRIWDNGTIIAEDLTVLTYTATVPFRTPHTFIVEAYGEANLPAASTPMEVTTATADITPPTLPVGTSENVTATTATLVWTPSADDVEVDYYNVRLGSVTAIPVSVEVPRINLTGLTAETPYKYYLSAVDTNGNQTNPALSFVEFVTAATPPPPLASQAVILDGPITNAIGLATGDVTVRYSAEFDYLDVDGATIRQNRLKQTFKVIEGVPSFKGQPVRLVIPPEGVYLEWLGVYRYGNSGTQNDPRKVLIVPEFESDGTTLTGHALYSKLINIAPDYNPGDPLPDWAIGLDAKVAQIIEIANLFQQYIVWDPSIEPDGSFRFVPKED